MATANFKNIDKYRRYQRGLTIHDLFPTIKNYCACGCGKKLTGKQKRWATNHCRENALIFYFVVKGDTEVIRNLIFKRDKGVCNMCKNKAPQWEADHIISICNGGGGCFLDNFQTLCISCHKLKTSELYTIPNDADFSATSFYYFPSILDAFRTISDLSNGQ